MHACVAPVMPQAQPCQVLGRFDPRADLVGVADAGVVDFEPREINAILKRKFHVRVVQLQLAVALAEVAPVLADGALGGGVGAAAVCLEVAVVGVRLAGRMLRESDHVRVRHPLVVRVGHECASVKMPEAFQVIWKVPLVSDTLPPKLT
ncbi:hypothetical protein C1Y40_04632 [Mycobacterium talmoniae]|uniref:Uncharacterized protein n=1 Tax=Mycobacterium talmoniae TaxID=1858794 RepID=A0A2S8BEY2_9MYCO|nr:hypothetical protein C1Y40_04632 [Mycobacterium talmoniae]